MDNNDALAPLQKPTSNRPLLGMTILVVEDSRFACEAIRLMCLRSGARIRRADCLGSARRHLKVYRPSAVVIDLGLPDGSGTELIRDLDMATPRVGAILGISGDTGAQADALEAGADQFLAKPLTSLAAFQQAILHSLPVECVPSGPRPVNDARISPDPAAYQDDMSHAANLLDDHTEGPVLDYVAQFLRGVARSAEDTPLADAARELARSRRGGAERRGAVSRVISMVQDRLDNRVTI